MVICKPDKMKTRARSRASRVQGGIIMENRGGNTTYTVEIGVPVLLFGKLWQEQGSAETEIFDHFC